MSFDSLDFRQKNAVLDIASSLDSFWAIFLADGSRESIKGYLDELAADYLKQESGGAA